MPAMTSSPLGETVRRWPRVAVIGAGAVGGYFGGRLAAAGAPVIMIGRQAFVAAVSEHGLVLDTLTGREVVRVEAATDLAAARDAELVLFCMKTPANAATARALAPHLLPEATVVGLQNGVDNVAQMRAAAGIEALPAVVYVAASVPAPGQVKHAGRGDLVLGPESDRTRALAGLFTAAGVPCRLTDNLDGELWAKFLCNCALNAVSALGQTTYGRLGRNADARRLVRAVVEEVLALARAERIALPGMADGDAAEAAVMRLTAQISEARSSTAQDLRRGRSTEIDSLNGYVARRGRELGVPAPVNHALFTLVKLAEDAAGRRP